MAQKDTLCEKAVERFLDGYNCAQSVLLTMFEHWNGKNSLIPKIATGFGAGIGRCGSVCGALTGGVMAIGTRYGTNRALAKKKLQCYKLSEMLYRKFELIHGSVYCKELIPYELSNPEQLAKARDAKIFEEKCPNFVRTVIEILSDLSEP